MKIATGKVIAGQIVIEGAPFEEGAMVTVLAAADEASFDLNPEQEAELLSSMQEADAGDMISAADLLSSLKPKP